MKKSLLILVAAFMVVMGANAQAKRIDFKNVKPMAVNEAFSAKPAMMNMEKPRTVADLKKFSRRADEAAPLTCILDYKNWDRDFTQSTLFTIENVAEGTITLDQYDKDETTGEYPTFTYNVVIKGFSDSRGTIYGYYDQTTSQIRIPVQTMFTNATYGRIVFTGLVLDSSDEPVSYGYELFLDVDKDGFVSVSDETFSEEDPETGETIEGLYVGGFYNIMPDYPNESTGAAGLWNYGFEIETFVPNAFIYSNETHLDNGWTEWTPMTEVAYIEDYGDEIVVHNFFGMVPASFSKEGDSYSLNLPLILDDYEYSVAHGAAFEAGFMQMWRMDDELKTLVTDGAITGSLIKTEDGNAIRFYDTEYREAWTDESGDHEAGNYIVNPSYFYMGSLPNDEGARYWIGERVKVVILGAEGVLPEPSAINEIAADAKGANQTYNLMGQKVAKDTKGLVIRDGKKFINK